jgi:hypothetical protein
VKSTDVFTGNIQQANVTILDRMELMVIIAFTINRATSGAQSPACVPTVLLGVLSNLQARLEKEKVHTTTTKKERMSLIHKGRLPPWAEKVLDRAYCLKSRCVDKGCSLAHCESKEEHTNVLRAIAEKKRAKYGVCRFGAKCQSFESTSPACKFAHAPDTETEKAWGRGRSVNPIYVQKESWCFDECRNIDCRFPEDCKSLHHEQSQTRMFLMLRDDANKRASFMFGEVLYLSDEEAF